jgi:hypothetical protein
MVVSSNGSVREGLAMPRVIPSFKLPDVDPTVAALSSSGVDWGLRDSCCTHRVDRDAVMAIPSSPEQSVQQA